MARLPGTTWAQCDGPERWELNVEWDQPIIGQVLRGFKKLTLRLIGAKLDLRKVLAEILVERLLILSDSLGSEEWSDLMLTGWEFFMRILSECLPFQCGERTDNQVLDL